MDDAFMAAEHASGEIDDVAGPRRLGPQPRDELRVIAVRHETDVLAVGLVRHRKAELGRKHAHVALHLAAQRKAQEIELRASGGKKEIALVTTRVGSDMELGSSRTL